MKLYFRFLAINIKGQLQYKVSFFMESLGQLITVFSILLGVCFLMDRFGAIQDYSLYEVLICYGVVFISYALGEVFGRGFDIFSGTIRRGEFDRILVRPRNESFLVICSNVRAIAWATLLQAVLVLCWGLSGCAIQWNFVRAAGLAFMILGGMAYFIGLFVIYASLCFFTVEGLEFMNIFTYGGREYGRYPVAVYGRNILMIFTFILPMACFQYYPFLYLVGRSDNPLLMLTPLFCFVFLIPCHLLWRFGVRHYTSTGS